MSAGRLRYCTTMGILTPTSVSPMTKYHSAIATMSENTFNPRCSVSPGITHGLPFQLLIPVADITAPFRSLALENMLVENALEPFLGDVTLDLSERRH